LALAAIHELHPLLPDLRRKPRSNGSTPAETAVLEVHIV